MKKTNAALAVKINKLIKENCEREKILFIINLKLENWMKQWYWKCMRKVGGW